jgi:NAD(P)-dependent dehydrogenase (short-subunit alcohol dehydrogenase family)
MSYFVTGATGFIGRHLVERLLQREGTIYALVRAGSRGRLEELRTSWGADGARVVPEEIARKHEVIPIARLGDLLCVAKANYYNRAAVQELRRVTGLKIKVIQADEAQVRAAIEMVYKGRKGELPAPTGKRKDTAMRTSSTSRIPLPSAVPPPDAIDVPLISMPENGNGNVAAPVMSEVRPRQDDLNEVIEILDAVHIPPAEYAAQQKDPIARMVLEFEDVFQSGKAAQPLRVS